MFKVGLTGGIGSGKSTVAQQFANLDVPVISTDNIAHQLTAVDSPHLKQIKHAFGDSIIQSNGQLNRPALAQLVFSDPLKKQVLESILHPPIKQAMERAANSFSTPYIIFEVPLLHEIGQYQDWNRILIVTTPLEIRKQRIAARDNIDYEQIEQIMAQQSSDSDRMKIADDIIDNSSELESLAIQVNHLHQKYLGLSA